MIAEHGEAWLVLGDALLRWSHAGYDERRDRGRGEVSVITPEPSVACLLAGYAPLLHPSAN